MATTLAAAQDLIEDLGTLEAGQTLYLPLDISSLTGEVAIEVDGIDMTDVAAVENGQLVLNIVTPLAGEFHDVTVYLLEGDGFVPIASYSFLTTAPSRLTVSVDASHEASIQSLNSDEAANASSSGSFGVENEEGSFRGQVSYLGSTRPVERVTENPVDIAEYLFEFNRTLGATNLTGRLGHQMLDYDRALVGDVSRRGLSVDMGLLDQRVELGAFASQSADALGAANFTGLADEDSRMQGARFAFQPFATQDFRVSVQTYTGDGDPYGGSATGSGQGSSLSLDGTLLGGRLYYGSVWSQTDWDEDDGGPLPETSANAVLSHLSYDVLNTDAGDRALTVGLGYEKVDQDYFSLANPGVAVGAETWRLTMDYSANRFALNIFADTQKTNVGGPSGWPEDRISQVLTDLRYDLQGEGFWQGTALRFGGGYLEQDRLTTPNAAPPPEDYTSTTLYVGFDKLGDVGNWSLDYVRIREDDQGVLDIDTDSRSLNAAFDYGVNDRANVNGTAGYTRVDGDFDTWERYEATLGFSYALRPDDLIFRLDTGITRTDEPFALDGEYYATELAWRFHPTAELVLSASRADGPYASESGGDEDTLVGLTLRATTNFFR
ncbi:MULTISPECIES: hypothetical protein [unclassified Ruegeria]|uniref:hypothetical protein n=1 Tax=unclassified Ruegeria TaxID=2625375 RepID=UPI0014890FD8|nr:MULTISPECIES: hypothetical protein [unclassified Ruegeria]